MAGLVADFVIARKETDYIKGTREPIVELGSLRDDLERRDFTVNAMAMDLEGNIIDYFGGQEDLQAGLIRTPKDTNLSFNDDPLRILRAIRFKITKRLEFTDEVIAAMGVIDGSRLGTVVSTERIREELYKCFKFNTYKTLEVLFFLRGINPTLYFNILGEEKDKQSALWLEPTTKS
jgi:tRNA nucleotidyltransferase/poly(A) polymerase